MKQAYLGLCAYNENRTEQLNRAVWAMHAVSGIKVTGVSRIYNVKENGISAFYCGGARIETSLSPTELFEACKNEIPKGLRLRLLRYEDAEQDDSRLTLPDPLLETEPCFICVMLNFVADKALKKRLKEIGEETVRVTGEGFYLPL